MSAGLDSLSPIARLFAVLLAGMPVLAVDDLVVVELGVASTSGQRAAAVTELIRSGLARIETIRRSVYVKDFPERYAKGIGGTVLSASVEVATLDGIVHCESPEPQGDDYDLAVLRLTAEGRRCFNAE